MNKGMNNKNPPATDRQTCFARMEKAISGVPSSNHPSPDSKIAANLVLQDGTQITAANIWLSAFNHMPAGPDGKIKIGNASPTIHAEIAALLLAIEQGCATQGATLYLTDPPCPNCVKMLLAAGVREINIDIKGFRKDWYTRRKEAFKTLSLPMAGQAGVRVNIIKRFKAKNTARRWQINRAFMEDGANSITNVGDTVTFTLPKNAGYTGDKYNRYLRPLNSLIATSAKTGQRPATTITYTGTPTGRELINLCGLQKLVYGDTPLTLKTQGTSPLLRVIEDYTNIIIE